MDQRARREHDLAAAAQVDLQVSDPIALQAKLDRGFEMACEMPIDDRTETWCARTNAQHLTWELDAE